MLSLTQMSGHLAVGETFSRACGSAWGSLAEPVQLHSSAGKSPVAAGKSKMEADLAGKIPRW